MINLLVFCRKYLLTIFLFLLTSSYAISGGGVGNDFKFYKNDQYSFTFYYPNDWDIQEINNGVNITNLNLVANPSLESNVKLMVVKDFVFENNDIESIKLEKLKEYLVKKYPEYEWDDALVNSMKGFQCNRSRNNKTNLVVNQMLFLIWKEYVLNFSATKNSHDHGGDKVQTIIDTTNLDTALFRAVKSNDLPEVKRLLKAGANIEARQEWDQSTPLMLASEYGVVNIINFLLENNADIEARDTRGETPIFYAAENDQVDAINILADWGAQIHRKNYRGRTPFMDAVMDEKFFAAKTLLKLGANIEEKDNYGRTILMIIAYISSSNYEHLTGSLRFLLQEGANVNSKDKYGNTPIMELALTKKYKFINLIVEHGANINAVTSRGRTALMKISTYGGEYFEISKLLIDLNIDIHKKDIDGQTALIMTSASRDSLNLVTLLVQKGANVNEQDNNGYNALMLASLFGRIENVRLLINAGANLNDKNRYGQTALGLASVWGQHDIVKLLKEAGAQ